MFRARCLHLAFAVAGLAATGWALAQDHRPVTLEAGADSPHAQVLRAQGWIADAAGDVSWAAPGQSADLRVLDARDALAERAAGHPVKVVYVVSRDAGRYQVLVVAEDVLLQQREKVAQAISLHERARAWLLEHPAAVQAAGRDLHVARPGPALAHDLAAGADAARSAEVAALLDDGPLREASARRTRDLSEIPAAKLAAVR